MLITVFWSFREVVLSKVDALVKDFVYRASLARGLSESIAASAGGKIFSFVSEEGRIGRRAPCLTLPNRAHTDWVYMDPDQTSTLSVWCQSMCSEKTSLPFLKRCYVRGKR
jgi:hypothetical protein